jgi:hypothetical protein
MMEQCRVVPVNEAHDQHHATDSDSVDSQRQASLEHRDSTTA